MDTSKRGYLSIGHGITLSKKNYPTTPEERERMSRMPYTSVVRSIMYVMMCTRSDVTYSLEIVSRYQSDLDEKH